MRHSPLSSIFEFRFFSVSFCWKSLNRWSKYRHSVAGTDFFEAKKVGYSKIQERGELRKYYKKRGKIIAAAPSSPYSRINLEAMRKSVRNQACDGNLDSPNRSQCILIYPISPNRVHYGIADCHSQKSDFASWIFFRILVFQIEIFGIFSEFWFFKTVEI